jgi:hypothetical protein
MGHGGIDEWKADARGRQETCRVGKKRENLEENVRKEEPGRWDKRKRKRCLIINPYAY